MAQKYKIEFSDISNELWRIEIDSPSYSGEVIELIPADKPLIIEYNGNQDDDIFRQHFIPSSATMSVVNTRVDIEELMYINDASYKCRIYRSGVLYWQGYVISDGIQEVDSGIPYDLTIRAIDGIEVLDNIPLRWNNYGSVIVNGQPSELRAPINAYRVSLYESSNLDNKLPIKWNTPLKNDQYPTRDMLAGATQIAPRGELLDKDNTCLWWLDNLSKSAQSWIYQRNGYWYINNYFRSLSGNFGGYEIEANTGQDIPAMVNNEPTITALTAEDTVNENWFWFGKKPYGSVTVTYDDTKFDGNNVVPNGNFDDWSLGSPLYWGFEPSTGNFPFMTSYESLYKRDGYAIDIQNLSSSSSEVVFTFNSSIPIDSSVLYKDILFGFTFMPLDGFNKNSNDVIDWSNHPMKVSLKYSLGNLDYYLNEFGFWQTEGRGLNLGVDYAGYVRTNVGLNQSTYESYYEGTPNIGDVLVIGIRGNAGGNHNEFSFTVTALEEGNLEVALIKLMDNIPNSINGWNISNKRVSMQSATRGSIRTSYYSPLGDPNGRTYKSGATQEFRYVYPTVDAMKTMDIATIAFSGKGGNNNIVIPQGLGELKLSFILPVGIRYVLDDVYITVADNHDVYTVSDYNTKNSKANYSMGISSSYSGNMESSYGDGYADRDKSMNFDGMTLTEGYARRIMEIRNRPMRVFSGSIDKIVEWGLFSLMGKVYAPLSMRLDVRDRITDVVGAEFTPSVSSWEVTHKSSGGG